MKIILQPRLDALAADGTAPRLSGCLLSTAQVRMAQCRICY